MNECDGNQLLENTNTETNWVISFLAEIPPNKRKLSNRVKSMVKKKQSADGKAGKLYAKKKSNLVATKASISLNLL